MTRVRPSEIASWIGAACAAALSIAIAARDRPELGACGPGFERWGSRCCPAHASVPGVCVANTRCPPPLVVRDGDCASPGTRVAIAATKLVWGPSDWEAEGRVAPRDLDVAAFSIDAFEVTLGEIDPTSTPGDRARAATNVTQREAAAFCAARGGRLPSDDEWTVAAAGARGSRYPWGDTGAVCRRAAWGLSAGPCANGPAAGADTVGAHPDGATPTGIHDLAGNVAEWVGDRSAARGGSFATTLAPDLRTWAREDLPEGSRSEQVGFRCVYSP